VPEQEFPPPHRPGGSYGPGPQDEDPPPWASLSPVRPARPRPGGREDVPGDGTWHGGRVSGDYPMGSWQAGGPAAPPDSAASDGPHWSEPVPEWAGPDADDPGDEQAPDALQRAPRGRAGRAARRRRRRWLFLLAGLVAVAGAATAVVLLPAGGPGPAPVTPGTLITNFQPGELQQVPNACGSVPAATVAQFLPGKVKVASPLPVDGAAESACNWTIDHAPVYRLLQLNMLAYAPNGLASGDGSATFAAIDAYDSALAGLQSPPRDSAAPRAAVATLSGLGSEAFSARQVFRRGGAVTDVATVVVRYHNVVVTVTVNGLQHSNRGGYGPVSASQLSSAALAFAQAAEATLH
jgi:hypothetical protein